MRKLGREEQELEDAVRPQFGGVDLAIGLERRAALKQADPLEVIAGIDRRGGIVGENAVVYVDQRGEHAGALDEAAELDEVPAFAVVHRGVGQALEHVRSGLYGFEEFVRRDASGFKQGDALHFVEEAVELLPHLGADLLADLAGVLARGHDV